MIDVVRRGRGENKAINPISSREGKQREETSEIRTAEREEETAGERGGEGKMSGYRESEIE